MLFARVFKSGESIAFGDCDERVAFIVFEIGVEERRELIDEVLLEHERLVLVIHHHVFKRRHLFEHHGYFGTFILPHDVLLHASTKLLRLANVNHLARSVFP